MLSWCSCILSDRDLIRLQMLNDKQPDFKPLQELTTSKRKELAGNAYHLGQWMANWTAHVCSGGLPAPSWPGLTRRFDFETEAIVDIEAAAYASLLKEDDMRPDPAGLRSGEILSHFL